MSGKLYLVATPIGNLADISARMSQTLTDVDFIAAEDTRVTRKLLEHLQIKKQLISYRKHNSRECGEKILGRLLEGQSCALVTDAGVPCVSDPGNELVRLCAGGGIPVIAIPGPCAAVTALSVSGLSGGRFTFEGFLGVSKKNRFDRLEELKTEHRTMVFYEAPHKLMRTLTDMLAAFGDRRVSVSRELTKLYEETLRCTLSEAIEHFNNTPPKGEFTLIVEGAPEDEPAAAADIVLAVAAAHSYVEQGLSSKDAVKRVSSETGLPKNTLYNLLVK